MNSMEQDGKGRMMVTTWPQCMQESQGSAECTATSAPALPVLHGDMRPFIFWPAVTNSGRQLLQCGGPGLAANQLQESHSLTAPSEPLRMVLL